MRIGYLQFEPLFGNIRHNLDLAEKLFDKAEADLLVLPELFNTGYFFTDMSELADLAEPLPGGPTTKKLEKIARKKKTHIVAGILEKDNGRYYNSAVLVNEKGYIDHYRKIHLFDEEKLFFQPGDKPFTVYDTGKAKIGIMICYDWIYPESMRVLALLGADIICHCANLVMPYCPTIMPSRCFDNKVYAVTANRTGKDVRGDREKAFIGKSMILSPQGTILQQAGPDETTVGIVEITPETARNKRMNRYNDLFADRRPEMYQALTTPNL